jgi:hypothetical protein
MVRAVLVAGDDDTRDAVVGHRSPLVVGLGDQRVHPLEHALRDARGLSQPGRGSDDEDLRREHALEDLRPLVAVALVAGDPGLDVEVGDADQVGVDARALQGVDHHARERLGVRLGGGGLERAVQDRGVHGARPTLLR